MNSSQEHPMDETTIHLEINLSTQKLQVKTGDNLLHEYTVSTAKNGAGEKQDSECTPRGKHVIAEKIGDGYAVNTVFSARVATGELCTPELYNHSPGRDWIITRILHLKGIEPGFNAGGDVDSYGRFIYIHGTPDATELGKPGSKGCIRMSNHDVIELFDKVETGTQVNIIE